MKVTAPADPALKVERDAYLEEEYPLYAGRRVQFWRDVDVRRRLIAAFGDLTNEEAREELAKSVELWRVPSKSALGRFWGTLKKLERQRLAQKRARR